MRTWVLWIFLAVILKAWSFDVTLSSRMGSKSTYNRRILFDEVKDTCQEAEEKCDVIEKVYILARHGSRNPTEGAFKRMNDIGLNVSFSERDLELLNAIGESEAQALGERVFHKYFRGSNTSLRSLHPSKYGFQSSQKPRVLQSAFMFMEGLRKQARLTFPRQPIHSPVLKSVEANHDLLLRGHKVCDVYKIEKMNTSRIDALHEVYELIVANLIENITILNTNLSGSLIKRVLTIFEACQFEFMLGQPYEHCQMFQTVPLLAEVAEYLQDAESFFKKGNSSSVNVALSCILRDDITSFFSKEKTILNRTYPFERVLIRYGHAETILPLISMLPVFHVSSEVFSSKLFLREEQVLKRSWRQGRIMPMSSNYIFELRSCNSGKKSVRIVANGKVIPWCYLDGVPLQDSMNQCTLDDFLQILQHKQCDYFKSCL